MHVKVCAYSSPVTSIVPRTKIRRFAQKCRKMSLPWLVLKPHIIIVISIIESFPYFLSEINSDITKRKNAL